MAENHETIIQNLESRVKEQDKQINDLKLRNLEFKVKEQDEQIKEQDKQINVLIQKVCEISIIIGKNDTHPSGMAPTTRQGDQLQKQITILEARLEALER